MITIIGWKNETKMRTKMTRKLTMEIKSQGNGRNTTATSESNTSLTWMAER